MSRFPSLVPFQFTSKIEVPLMDLHLHTRWTDGKNSAAEMHQAAIAQGLKLILFSEHARKTSGDWFKDFAREVRSLPDKLCRALVGVETKVDDFDGTLDISDEILKECDLVMASVHRFPGEVGDVKGPGNFSLREAYEIEFQLAEAALHNAKTDILGHPFGMTYKRFKGAPPETLMRDLIKIAGKTGVAFEVNSHYHPEPWKLIEWCLEDGATISLGSNAHEVSGVGKIQKVLSERPVV